jgi:hypothetical protein
VATRTTWGVNAFGNAMGESLASQSQRQGEGPWSSKDHVNGTDLESDQATSRRVLAEAMARPGLSESDYWSGRGRTVADQYVETYGGETVDVSGRGMAGRGDVPGEVQTNTLRGPDYRKRINFDGTTQEYYVLPTVEVTAKRSAPISGGQSLRTLGDLAASPALTVSSIDPIDLSSVSNSLASLPSSAPTWQEGLQAQNDAGVIAGSYGKFGAAADAARAGNWDQAWFHLNYAASDQARAAVYARVNPSPDPRFALIDAARNGPMGAMTALAYRNASPQEQIYASQAATHIDTLIAPGRQRASVSGLAEWPAIAQRSKRRQQSSHKRCFCSRFYASLRSTRSSPRPTSCSLSRHSVPVHEARCSGAGCTRVGWAAPLLLSCFDLASRN